MSRKASPTTIGAFVIGAIALVIGGILVFGSGALFEDTTTYVMYFDDSVSGLSPGAPVVFRGVKVGEVTDIMGSIDESLDIAIPVFVKLGGARIEPRGFDPATAPGRDQVIPVLIKRGLRAQLGLQSVVTGQLLIALDFLPDTEPRFVGHPDYPEIPTAPSPMSEMLARLRELPLQEIAAEALVVLKSIDSFVGSDDLRNSVRNLNQALVSVRKLSDNLDQRVEPLAASADDALATLGEDSPTRYALDEALVELGAAARSIRILAEYLERHPEALLAGKPTGGQ